MSGHKSYECKLRKKKEGKEKTTTTITSTMKAKEKKIKKKTRIFNTHTKKVNEGKEATPYLLKKIHDGKVVAYKIGVGEKYWY